MVVEPGGRIDTLALPAVRAITHLSAQPYYGAKWRTRDIGRSSVKQSGEKDRCQSNRSAAPRMNKKVWITAHRLIDGQIRRRRVCSYPSGMDRSGLDLSISRQSKKGVFVSSVQSDSRAEGGAISGPTFGTQPSLTSTLL